MASAAEQLAASVNFGALSKAKELKKKIDCEFQLTYIPREKNEIADELAKNAISYKIQYFLQEKKKKK